jgi:hypothetical protein
LSIIGINTKELIINKIRESTIILLVFDILKDI